MRAIRLLRSASFAIFASLVCINANATLINFTETTDLPEDFSTSFEINMAGTNTWSGTSAFDTDAQTADVDQFRLAVAAGFEIVSIEVLISQIDIVNPGSSIGAPSRDPGKSRL